MKVSQVSKNQPHKKRNYSPADGEQCLETEEVNRLMIEGSSGEKDCIYVYEAGDEFTVVLSIEHFENMTRRGDKLLIKVKS